MVDADILNEDRPAEITQAELETLDLDAFEGQDNAVVQRHLTAMAARATEGQLKAVLEIALPAMIDVEELRRRYVDRRMEVVKRLRGN